MSIVRLSRALRAARDDDRGVALATVLVFMIAGVLLSLVVASTVLYAFTFSSSTRASVQSQAAAEAGIAVARAALLNGECATTNGAFQSTTEPAYSVQIYKPNGSGGWTAGCPALSEQARIVAEGVAGTPGTGDSSADTAQVEAILGNAVGEVLPGGKGPAIYAYDATGFGGSGTLISTDGTTPDVLLQTGDATCVGDSTGAVNLVLKSGTFTATGSCKVAGSIWINGAATIANSAQIGGSLTATSITGTGKVGGNVWSDGAVNMTWGDKVSGWVSGNSLVIKGGDIVGKSWARSGNSTFDGGTQTGANYTTGNVTVSNGTAPPIYATGNLTVTGGTLNGGRIAGTACLGNSTFNANMVVRALSTASGCFTQSSHGWWGGWSKVTVNSGTTVTVDPSPSKPTAVTVPGWVDFGGKPAHYTAAGWGTEYVLVKLAAGPCAEAEFHAALQAIGSHKGIVDGRACVGGIKAFHGDATKYYEDDKKSGSNAWRVRNDLVVIDDEFNLNNGSFNGHGGAHQLWLINPDEIENGKPDCKAGEYMTVSGGIKFTNVAVMMYTPCQLGIASSTVFTGQIFAYRVSVAGGAKITYQALGLPGYDLDTGLETGPSLSEADREVVVQRNITG